MSTSIRVKDGCAYEQGEEAGWAWRQAQPHHPIPNPPKGLTSRQRKRWRLGFLAGCSGAQDYLLIYREKRRSTSAAEAAEQRLNALARLLERIDGPRRARPLVGPADTLHEDHHGLASSSA